MPGRFWLGLLTALLVFVPGCSFRSDAPDGIQLYEELGGFGRRVTTLSEPAQQYFDQGLTLYYAFNHQAAIASFKRAASLDPKCAMAYWGQSLAAGPHINNPQMDQEASKLAWEALSQAKKYAADATPVEQALIDALSNRYTWPAPEDRSELDRAFAVAMRKVWEANQSDADVGTLFAESLMDLRPWDLWSAEGEPRPETPEVIGTLEAVLKVVPDHPGASHLLIHAMEASPDPGRALAAAEVLRDRIPGAGHLVHMPAHIFIRIGRYGDAMMANQLAIQADQPWASSGGFYSIYRAHNFHFLAYAAMFQGAREIASTAARDLVAAIPLALVRSYPDLLDAFVAVPYHVHVRFGEWEPILESPPPPDDLVATRAFWHYARTVALAASGRVAEADRELEQLRAAYAAIPESRMVGNNPARVVLDIGLPMAEGEIEYRRGNHERAFLLLREAVRLDDQLKYDEPWGWMMPVRHSLGALLLEQGRVEEAEAVYREDLRLHPNNGWALHGLAECLHRQGRHEEAMRADESFRRAWKGADIEINGSCYCRIGV